LIETRFLFHRMANCLGDLPHIDMLHPARCLWRSDRHDPDSSCRLAAMEETLLGHVRGGDVPGFEIPSRYFHYVRTSDPRPLSVVLEHNRLDVLALAMLTARAARLLDEGAGAARAAREALGLGRLYERGGMTAEARACYARAADFRPAEAGPHDVSESDVVTRAEALRAYAVLCRRDRDFEEAAAAWRELLDLYSCPARLVREATEALAVHHEHRARNLPAARGFAVKSLEFAMTAARAQAVRYRLARLDRKLAVSPYPALLFSAGRKGPPYGPVGRPFMGRLPLSCFGMNHGCLVTRTTREDFDMLLLIRPFCALVLALLLADCGLITRERKSADPPAAPEAKAIAAADAPVLADFTARLDNYLEVQRKLAHYSPRLEETDNPAKIAAAQDVLAAKVRTARKDARQGDIFTPEVAALFRRLIYPELKGAEGRETKGNIRDEHATVPLKVNAKYPTSQPLPTVPPNVLASLPQLPMDVEYRIADGHLILRDVDADIIVDYIPNAIR
jgi:tetratricopeptide (TPR) repeat protein